MRTSVSPRSIYVADPVTARVEVFFDPRVVDPKSVRVDTAFGRWRQLDAPLTTSTAGSSLDRETWAFTVSCLAVSCVPQPRSVDPERLPNVVVSARTRQGRTVRVASGWPAVNVAARFEPPPLHRPVPFIVQSSLPAVGFRFGPSWAAPLLLALGIAAIAVGLGLGAAELVRRRRRRPGEATVPRLARSLALVRQARTREPDARRRAVGHLARTLAEEGNGLATTAAGMAWSAVPPSPGALDEIVRTVERELEGAG